MFSLGLTAIDNAIVLRLSSTRKCARTCGTADWFTLRASFHRLLNLTKSWPPCHSPYSVTWTGDGRRDRPKSFPSFRPPFPGEMAEQGRRYWSNRSLRSQVVRVVSVHSGVRQYYMAGQHMIHWRESVQQQRRSLLLILPPSFLLNYSTSATTYIARVHPTYSLIIWWERDVSLVDISFLARLRLSPSLSLSLISIVTTTICISP